MTDVGVGDLWYFPEGIPHSIQGLPPDGAEFVLAFPNGNFSEDTTFAISDLFAHMPKPALAHNSALPRPRSTAFPKEERFIFQTEPPPDLQADTIEDPQGRVPLDMGFGLLQQAPTRTRGGQVRIADARNFTISSTVAAALVEVDSGHLREIHWHPNADEWQYYIAGQGRMTVFGAEGKARTFDFQAGDVGYVPKSMAHFVENTGESQLRFLELFNAPRFVDVSLMQWMALTPRELMQAHLNLDRELLDKLPKDKRPVV